MSGKPSRPRVLFVLKRYPWPMTDGASLRRLNIIKRLQHRFVFDLYCYADRAEIPPELGDYFHEIISRPAPPGMSVQPSGLRSTELEPDRNFPVGEEAQYDLQGLLGSDDFRLAVSSSGMLSCLPRHAGVPIVGDIIDNDCLAIWTALRYPEGPRDLFRQIKALAIAVAHQRRFFRRVSHVCYVSEVDAAFSRWITRYPEHVVIPNGVDQNFFNLAEERPPMCAIAFEGNMSFPPNVDAVRHFVSDILPGIRAVTPEVHVYLVGKDPHPDILALASDKITVTGFVEDIRPWLSKADLFVSPMRIGSGIKNKILQAWAMGIPVVATTKSTGGLKVENGQNIVVRDRSDDFAEAVISMLGDGSPARSIGLAGRKTIEQYYTWERLAARYGDMLDLAIEAGPG